MRRPLAPIAASARDDRQSADRMPVSVTAVRVDEAGRRFPARLAQPAAPAPGTRPVVVFAHAFTQSPARYASTLRALASLGHIVIAPASHTGLLPDHSAFADDLWAAAAWTRRTQPDAHPDLCAVVGHSLGGGAAILAASRHPEFDAVATLAAAETRPSARAAARAVIAPALFVVGSSDSIVPPATTRAIYDATPAPATWVSITGGYHCGFLDSSSFLGFGCDDGSIPRATQLRISDALVGDWLDATLRGGSFGWPSTTVGERR